MKNSRDKPWENKLYFGDNLGILRDKIPDDFIGFDELRNEELGLEEFVNGHVPISRSQKKP